MSPARPAVTVSDAASRKPLAVWLAGTLGLHDYLAMAERLAGEVADPAGRNPTLLVCELEPCISIGRAGSRADVRLADDELRLHRLALRFVGRGGGAVAHGPGQVVAAMFARLADLGISAHDAGAYVAGFQEGVQAAIAAVSGGGMALPGLHGVFGRTGLLAAVGIAVRRGVACHGAFVNVCPALATWQRVDTIPERMLPTGQRVGSTMGSLEADVRRRIRLQDVRTALVQGLADAFGFPRTHLNAGFPIRLQPPSSQQERASRVG